MSNYLFIQSQDPFTETRTRHQFDLALQLFEAGHDVRLLLVQNGVTPARKGADTPHFDALLKAGLSVSADDFSLQQRQIDGSDLKDKVGIDPIGTVVDALLNGDKVIWN